MKIEYEYCPKCKTISAVTFNGVRLPKQCKCKAEASGEEWITDQETLKKFIEEGLNGK